MLIPKEAVFNKLNFFFHIPIFSVLFQLQKYNNLGAKTEEFIATSLLFLLLLSYA